MPMFLVVFHFPLSTCSIDDDDENHVLIKENVLLAEELNEEAPQMKLCTRYDSTDPKNHFHDFRFSAKKPQPKTQCRRGQISSAFRKRKSLCISNAWNMASFEFRSAKECSRAELICMIKVALGQSLAEPILWFAWNYKGFLFSRLLRRQKGRGKREHDPNFPLTTRRVFFCKLVDYCYSDAWV